MVREKRFLKRLLVAVVACWVLHTSPGYAQVERVQELINQCGYTCDFSKCWGTCAEESQKLQAMLRDVGLKTERWVGGGHVWLETLGPHGESILIDPTATQFLPGYNQVYVGPKEGLKALFDKFRVDRFSTLYGKRMVGAEYYEVTISGKKVPLDAESVKRLGIEMKPLAYAHDLPPAPPTVSAACTPKVGQPAPRGPSFSGPNAGQSAPGGSTPSGAPSRGALLARTSAQRAIVPTIGQAVPGAPGARVPPIVPVLVAAKAPVALEAAVAAEVPVALEAAAAAGARTSSWLNPFDYVIVNNRLSRFMLNNRVTRFGARVAGPAGAVLQYGKMGCDIAEIRRRQDEYNRTSGDPRFSSTSRVETAAWWSGTEAQLKRQLGIP